MGLTIRVGALGGSKLLTRFKGREGVLSDFGVTSQQLVKRSKVLLILVTLGVDEAAISLLFTELLLPAIANPKDRQLILRSDRDSDARFPRRFPLRLPLPLPQDDLLWTDPPSMSPTVLFDLL